MLVLILVHITRCFIHKCIPLMLSSLKFVGGFQNVRYSYSVITCATGESEI